MSLWIGKVIRSYRTSVSRAFSSRIKTMALHLPSPTACAVVNDVQMEMKDQSSSDILSSVPNTLDKDRFRQVMSLPALRVPLKECGKFVAALRDRGLLNIQKVKAVVVDSENTDSRTILLATGTTRESLPPDVQQLLSLPDVEFTTHNLVLGYDHWSIDHVLRQLLPPDITVPASWETVGHIAHLNLRDSQLPYRYLIGQVLLDKIPYISTVVNKVGTINNQFRVFPLEVVAGESKFLAEVKEDGCIFKLDYSKVYWNSKLQAEHQRLASSFRRKEVICDMFAGVGPFAIRAGKRGCSVYANDLNPSSYEYLVKNIAVNKVPRNVYAFNMDARAFVKDMHTKQLANTVPAFDHVIMNLPQIAIDFLDVFRSIYGKSTPNSPPKSARPVIHCYCFCAEATAREAVVKRVENVLGVTLPPLSPLSFVPAPITAAPQDGSAETKGEEDQPSDEANSVNVDEPQQGKRGSRKKKVASHKSSDSRPSKKSHGAGAVSNNVVPDDVRSGQFTQLRMVRNVAPNSEMYCISFRLPDYLPLLPEDNSTGASSASAGHISAADSGRRSPISDKNGGDIESPPTKKCKTDPQP